MSGAWVGPVRLGSSWNTNPTRGRWGWSRSGGRFASGSGAFAGRRACGLGTRDSTWLTSAADTYTVRAYISGARAGRCHGSGRIEESNDGDVRARCGGVDFWRRAGRGAGDGRPPAERRATCSCGSGAAGRVERLPCRSTALLPAGGVRPGSLIELFGGADVATAGSGAATLACAVACRLARTSADASCESVRPAADDRGGRPQRLVSPAGRAAVAGRRAPARRGPALARRRRNLDDRSGASLHRRGGRAGVAPADRPRAAQWEAGGCGRQPRCSSGPPPCAAGSWRRLRAEPSVFSCGPCGPPCDLRGRKRGSSCRPGLGPRRGTLLERSCGWWRLGGHWSAADRDTERSAEVVLDLARGVEAPPRPSSLVRERSPFAGTIFRGSGRASSRGPS